MIESAVGVEYAISTNQLDFLSSETFDLGYVGEDGERHPIYVIHRAPLGSHERFVAFLIEHYAGRFPTWLAPVQARVIGVADRHLPYAERVCERLLAADVRSGTGEIRAEVDHSRGRMQKKVRDAQQEQIPYILIVGDREAESATVSIRLRGGESLGARPVQSLIERIRTEIESRHDLPAGR